MRPINLPFHLSTTLLALVLGPGCAEPTGKGGQGELDTGAVVSQDGDGDGYGPDTDCDDGNPAVWPDAAELCDGVDNDCDGEVDEGVATAYFPDTDADGFGDPAGEVSACEPPEGHVAAGGDCADADADTYPDAPERCDGTDNDCDGTIDEEVTLTWFLDSDGDGFGDPEAGVDACDPESGYVANADDCEDSSAISYPGAREVCDELDNDCDTVVDEEVTESYYADTDADGFGDISEVIEACTLPEGYSENAEDCDDGEVAVNPAATETCNGRDDDCDALLDEPDAADAPTFFLDNDADGYGDPDSPTRACSLPEGAVEDNTDCDDANFGVHPSAVEVCGGIDDDCDGLIDDDDAADLSAGGVDLSTGILFYADVDGDTFGDPTNATLFCVNPTGWLTDNQDCDDGDRDVHPFATEICNGIDDDCDTATDDADPGVDPSTFSTFWTDADADGYGNFGLPLGACDLPAGAANNSADCDDGASAVNPAAIEVCNGIDDNCNTRADDADVGLLISTTTWFYADVDNDGFGDAAAGVQRCAQPVGTVTDATDCDDGAAAVSPAATEICNGTDDDCDGTLDDGDASLDLSSATAWYPDTDGDSYGNPASSTRQCIAPVGTIDNGDDCNDGNAAVHPGATETCNSIDDDCDSLTDDTDPGLDLSTATLRYQDADADTYGNNAVTTRTCTLPSGYVNRGDDCNDAAATVNPAATESCNGVDDNCDGSTDPSSSVDANTYYLDGDNDGFGTSSGTARACSRPSGYATTTTDCDDSRNTVYPGATETCDGRDNDCDTYADEGVIGRGSSCPALSCEAILTDDPSATSGTYSLRPESTTFSAYCDMSADGGGWTLLFSCDANNAAYGSGWNGWWGTSLSSTVDDLADRGKGLAYDELDFSDVRLTATVPNASTLIFTTGTVFEDMHAMIGTEPTSCSGLSSGSGRRRYTATTRTGSFWQSTTVDIVICDQDGSSSLETTSAGNHDLAVFSTDNSHGNYNNINGTLGTEYTCAGGSSSYGTSANTVRLWAR